MAFHHRKLNFMANGSDYASALGDSDCVELCAQKKTGKVCVYSNCIDFCPDLCNTPPPPKSPGLSLLLTISLSALAAAFFLFTCYTIYKLYSNWRRRRQPPLRQDDAGGPDEFLDQDQGPVADHHIWYIRTVGLQPSVIGAITIVKYKKGDGLIDGTDCSVCLSEFQEDETLRLLPKCNHAFHVACIDTWLRSHTNCPMCRAGIVAGSARLSSQEQAVQDSAEEARNGNGDDEPAESRIGIEDDDTVSRAPAGPETLRRSISVDALSSDRKLDNQLVGVNVAKRGGLLRLIGSSSIERSGSSSMKRSLSCSANVFFSRNRS